MPSKEPYRFCGCGTDRPTNAARTAPPCRRLRLREPSVKCGYLSLILQAKIMRQDQALALSPQWKIAMIPLDESRSAAAVRTVL